MSSGRRKRKRKRRIHWGRMVFVLLLLVLIAGGVIFAISSCSTESYNDEGSFEKYAHEYFDSIDGKQEVGETKESINYGEIKSVAMEYPEMKDVGMNEKIAAAMKQGQDAFHTKYNAEADRKEGKYALLMGYESYKTDDKVISVVMHEDQREEEEKEMRTVSSKVYAYNFSEENGMNLSPIQVFNSDYREGVSAYMKEYLTDKYGEELVFGYENFVSSDAENFNNFALKKGKITFYFDAGTILPEEKGVVAVDMTDSDLEGIKRDKINTRAIDPDKPMVAITYDDGPASGTSDRILDCFEKHNAVATFFELGQNVETVKDSEKILKRELELGCEIGSHSYSHPNLIALSDSAVKEQVNKTSEAIKSRTGQDPTVFRPPYGNINDAIGKTVNLPCILWSVDSMDWQSKNADAVLKRIRKEKDLDGRVILMHSIYESSAEATEELVPWLLDRGYQLVTVSELLTYKYQEEPTNGKVYGYDYFYLDKD